MNQSFYTFCGSLCAVLLIATLVKILAPKEKMNKTVSLIIGLFFLVSVTSPVVNLVRDFELPDENIELIKDDNKNITDDYVLEETADYLSNYLKESLNGAGVGCSSVTVSMINDDYKGIYLDSVCIYLDEYSVENSLKASHFVSSAVGVEPEIICENSEGIYG